MSYEYEPEDDYYDGPEDDIDARIAWLEQRLGIDPDEDYEDDFDVEPTEDQIDLTNIRIAALEEEYGIELSDEGYDRVGHLANGELADDLEGAFALVVSQEGEDEVAWTEDFTEQIKEEEKERPRKFTPAEIAKIRDRHPDVGPVDVKATIEALWGPNDPELQEAHAEAKRDLEAYQQIVAKLEEEAPVASPDVAYPTSYVKAHAEQLARAQADLAERQEAVDQAAEKLKGEIGSGGIGDHEVDTEKGRAEWSRAMEAPAIEQKQVEEVSSEFDTDTSAGRAAAMDAALAGRIIQDEDSQPDETEQRVDDALTRDPVVPEDNAVEAA